MLASPPNSAPPQSAPPPLRSSQLRFAQLRAAPPRSAPPPPPQVVGSLTVLPSEWPPEASGPAGGQIFVNGTKEVYACHTTPGSRYTIDFADIGQAGAGNCVFGVCVRVCACMCVCVVVGGGHVGRGEGGEYP